MIPIKLTIEGLYSYQERQTIDFTSLTDAGLFGIFGSVGSGKSSILEAISYALYGETERLNARDKRTYNMMNLKSNRSYIEFDFKNYENQMYRATREFKRNSKNFDDVRPPVVTFYHFKNNQWIPLQNADAEKIIGLSYTNFKRTIIIPQGQFKEFLELGEAERTKMMKEIFGLQKFDLFDNASKINKQNQTELDQLSGQLKGFEVVSQLNIDELTIKLSDAELKHQTLLNQFEKENNYYQQLKINKTDIDLLNTKSNELELLTDEKSLLENRKKVVDEYEVISLTFDVLLKDKWRTEQAISQNNNEITSFKHELIATNNELEIAEEQAIHLQKQFDNLPNKRAEENDWEFVIKNIEAHKNIRLLQERLTKGVNEVNKVTSEILSLENKISSSENELTLLAEKRVDTQLLLQIDQWFTQKDFLLKELTRLELEVNEQKNKIEELTKNTLLEKINLENFNSAFNEFKQQFETKKSTLNHKKNQLLVQQQIATYAHDLNDGEPCPLCGSESHPHIVEVLDVSNNLKLVDDEFFLQEKLWQEWQNNATEVNRIIELKQIFTNQLANKTIERNDLLDQIAKHNESFIWELFDKNGLEAFQKVKTTSFNIESKMQETSNLLNEYRTDLSLKRTNLDRYRIELETITQKETQFNTQIESNLALMQILNWIDLSHLTSEEAHEILGNLKSENTAIETNYLKNIELKNQLNQQKSAKTATIDLLEKQNNTLNSELTTFNEQINQALQQHQKIDLSEVLTIINQSINIVEERKIWGAFSIKFQTLKQLIDDLKSKVEKFDFNEENFAFQEQLVNKLNGELTIATELKISLKDEKNRLEKAFEEKRILLEKQAALQNRADNLKTMLNLFKGAGFVQYVSSIYLRQLCNQANERFHRMTRNQLSLQLNEKGDFEIIDYLNEGRSRSVKTLSGGQAFQASLCLALALAESVQTNAKADKNFFFIDEGFGTQDAASVNIVFETLTSLQKENRIVGIISHVEELKERIPVALQITKSDESGSVIQFV